MEKKILALDSKKDTFLTTAKVQIVFPTLNFSHSVILLNMHSVAPSPFSSSPLLFCLVDGDFDGGRPNRSY